MNICIKVAGASNKFENTNTDLKKHYLIRNIRVINTIVSKVPGYCGSFGTGYPFYVLDSDMSADGIETNYIYIDRFKNKINEIEHWNDFARQYGFKTSIGSDFHTKDRLYPVVGLIGENLKNDDIDSIMEWLVD